MKKIFVLLLALVMSFAFISCGDDNTSGADSTSATKSAAGSQTGASDSAELQGKEITLTLYNATELDFTSIAISKAGQNKSGENLISETLKARSNVAIKIKKPADSEESQFEVLAKDTKGKTVTFKYLDLSELSEKGGSISLDMTEAGDAMALFSKPYVKPTLTIDSAPTKLKYKVGEKYDPSGFSATYTDEEGEAVKLGASDVKFIVSETVEITEGRAFTTAGKKIVVVHYAGLKQQFELVVE